MDVTIRRWRWLVLLAVLLLCGIPRGPAQPGDKTAIPTTPAELFAEGKDQKKALKVNEAIYQGIGFGNTFLVVTGAGNVVIDTSNATTAVRHKKLLQAESAAPVKYIVLTHAHGDHTGGVSAWREKDTQVVAQKQHLEFMHYQARLDGFFGARNAAQFSRPLPKPSPWPGNYGAKIEPTVLFDDKYEVELGGLKFKVLHTPGETPDHATVWIPKYKAVFVGDNFYRSFPNLYTLRGTQPRSALDYIRSLNKVLALKPEILLPSHGLPIHGAEEITKALTRYRDAIQYVHDETVKGMNAGLDVHTLMRQVKLPRELDVGESYGKLEWSVRGIYEGYAGWFDGNPATMYAAPPSSVHPDLVKLAGGSDAIAKRARERAEAGEAVEALHLTDVALAADPKHRPSLEARLKALDLLQSHCRNANERGWLDHAIAVTQAKLRDK